MSRGDSYLHDDESFEELNLADEFPCYKWFNSLQEKLDEAGMFIDLNDPESAARLMVVDLEKISDDEDEYLFTLHFALKPNDPQNDIRFETEGETDDANAFREQYAKDISDIVKGCNAAALKYEDIKKLYEKAREGHLLILPSNVITDGTPGRRQIYVGEDGLPVIGRSGNDLEGDEKLIFENCVPVEEPEKPDTAIEDLAKMAKAGNKDAEWKLDDYIKKKDQYDAWQRVEAIGKEFPEFKERVQYFRNCDAFVFGPGATYVQNQSMGFTMAAADVSDARLVKKLAKPLSDKMPPAEYSTMIGGRSVLSLSGIQSELENQKDQVNPVVTDKLLDAMAESMVCHYEARRIKASSEIPGSDIAVMNEKQYQKQKQTILNSRFFRVGVKNIDFNDLRSLKKEKTDEEFIREVVKKANAKVNKADSEAKEVDLRTVRDRYADFYRRLKDDDSVLNWNNSKQYKELLDAFRAAAPYLTVNEGILNQEDSLKMREHLVKIAKKAESYRDHIGSRGKNERQERRRVITDELLEFSDSLVNPDAAEAQKDECWKNVTHKYNIKAVIAPRNEREIGPRSGI